MNDPLRRVNTGDNTPAVIHYRVVAGDRLKLCFAAQLDKHMLLGIDSPNPVLSWTISHTERAASQSAFQVIVYEDRKLATVFWKSSKIYNKAKTSLKYDGPTLCTAKTYFWQVLWWDHKGEVAVSEETGHFLVAILDPSDWDGAEWIAAGVGINTAPYLHKTFAIDSSNITSAALYISGLGFSKPFVNGIDLNARYDPPIALTPAWTNYEKLVPYTAYDISDLASKNKSLDVGVILGRGWRNTVDYPPLDNANLAVNDTTERVLKILLFIHHNGSNLTLVSDESWKADETKVSFDSIFDGETYGTKADYQLKTDFSVVVVPGPNGEMYLPKMPYIAEVGVEKPVNIYTLYDNRGFHLSQIVDFENNSAGYCQVFNDYVSSYELRFSEVTVHQPYGKKNGSLYFGSNRNAEPKEVYLGKKNFTYKPSFTYHGFRYVEVQGFGSLTLTEKNIQKIVVHSNLARNSRFESSVPILNKIQEVCVRSQLSNFMSIITDCPQRDERLGWLGDASASAMSMTLNFDMQAFHYNTLKLIKSEIINGTIPDVVPYYRYDGKRPGDPTWSAAFIEIFYRLVVYDLDVEIAKEFYASAMDVIFTTANSIPPQGMGQLPNCYYGDWIPAGSVHTQNNRFTGAFSFLMNLKQMIEIANILEKNEDSVLLMKMLVKYLDDFNNAFMTKEDMYLKGLQESYVVPLILGAVPTALVDDFENNFLNLLEDMGKNIYVTGGIVTVRYIFPLLSKLGQHDVALEIAQRTIFPSYGYMIYNNLEPSTTLWELWNVDFGSKNSRNHHMFSSISGWLVTDVAGISLEDGYDEIHFYPARALGLSHASVSLKYPKPLHLSWHRSGGVQCAKQVENRSPLNPILPKNEDLTISCGHEDGGTIAAVLFSSYGNPEGHCGGYYKLGSCHAPNSLEVVEKLCLGRRSCTVPTGANFWGNPCHNSSRCLIVSVQCKSETAELVYSSIAVNISVPMGSRGFLHLPTHGKQNMRLLEGNNVVYSESSGLNSPLALGVLSSHWDSTLTSLLVELDSGDYSFTWKGDDPHRRYIDSRSVFLKDDTLELECSNSTGIITAINWASYGNPEVKSSPRIIYHLGECHAGSSKHAVERQCVGKAKCTIQLNQSFFGKMRCLELLQQSHVIIDYSCSAYDRFKKTSNY